jgi:hypothetical protein
LVRVGWNDDATLSGFRSTYANRAAAHLYSAHVTEVSPMSDWASCGESTLLGFLSYLFLTIVIKMYRSINFLQNLPFHIEIALQPLFEMAGVNTNPAVALVQFCVPTAVSNGGKNRSVFKKSYFFINFDRGKLYTKIVAFVEIYNFLVQNFLIRSHLELQVIDILPSSKFLILNLNIVPII